MPRSRPLLVTAVALGLVAGSTADAAPRRPRTVSHRYVKPALGEPDTPTIGFCWTVYRPGQPVENNGCVRFQPGPRETLLSFRIVDDSGLPVRGKAYQRNEYGMGELLVDFCGESEPVPIRDDEVLLWLISTTSPDTPCLGTATTGVVHGEFR